MINIGLYYKVKKGNEASFEKIFEGVIQHLKNSVDGFLDGKLYRSVSEPSEYMIYSEWRDIDAFRKFTTSEAFRSTTHEGASIIEGRPYHRILGTVNEPGKS